MLDLHPVIPLRDRKHSVSARVHIARNAPLVVLTHGLGSDIDGEFERNVEHELHSSGFSTLLFNSYNGGIRGRALADMSLRDHIHDLDDVIHWATMTYAPRRTVLAGHSLGGLVALLHGETDIDAMVLCDPSSGPGLAEELIVHGELSTDNRYHCHWVEEAAELVIHRSLVDELQGADGYKAAARLTVPLLVLSAARGALTPLGFRYAKLAGGRQEILQDAEHALLRPLDAKLVVKAITDLAKAPAEVALGM